MLLLPCIPSGWKIQKVEVDMAATASKPVKVKCTLSDEKKIKIFISDLMIQAYCLYVQEAKIESEKVNKIRSF